MGADLEKGEWDPYWGEFIQATASTCDELTPATDRVPKFFVIPASKGSKYERNKAERVANIQRLLAGNPEREAEMREERRKAKDFNSVELFLRKYKFIK